MKFGVFLGILIAVDGWCADSELDPASAEALAKTQALLKTPALRQEAIRNNPNAQIVDAQARSMGGTRGSGRVARPAPLSP